MYDSRRKDKIKIRGMLKYGGKNVKKFVQC